VVHARLHQRQQQLPQQQFDFESGQRSRRGLRQQRDMQTDQPGRSRQSTEEALPAAPPQPELSLISSAPPVSSSPSVAGTSGAAASSSPCLSATALSPSHLSHEVALTSAVAAPEPPLTASPVSSPSMPCARRPLRSQASCPVTFAQPPSSSTTSPSDAACRLGV